MTDEAKRCVVALRTKCREEGSCDACGKNSFCHLHGDEELSDLAANLIESLSAELEQVKHERDVAVEEWKQSAIAEKSMCDTCMFSDDEGRCWNDCIDGELWQWRGVKEGSDA